MTPTYILTGTVLYLYVPVVHSVPGTWYQLKTDGYISNGSGHKKRHPYVWFVRKLEVFTNSQNLSRGFYASFYAL